MDGPRRPGSTFPAVDLPVWHWSGQWQERRLPLPQRRSGALLPDSRSEAASGRRLWSASSAKASANCWAFEYLRIVYPQLGTIVKCLIMAEHTITFSSWELGALLKC